MKALLRNWKAIIALVLVLAAAGVYFMVYRPAQKEFKSKEQELNTMITALQSTIAENLTYADIQDKLTAATEELQSSRTELFQKFPAYLLEEDQIMYVLYLEEIFGTEIRFEFGSYTPVHVFSDGSALQILTLTINYETDYAGFKEMINYLATDSRITSIQTASMQYDETNDMAIGSMTLSRYVITNSVNVEYQSPDVTTPSTGKPNIFG